MKISVSGRNIKVGEITTKYAITALEKCVKKYFEKTMFGHVVMSKNTKNAGLFHTSIIVNCGPDDRNITIKSHADEDDAHKSIDSAIHIIEKQLSRYKDKIKKHYKKTKEHKDDILSLSATKYVIPIENNDDILDDDITGGDENGPAIIAEKQVSVDMMGVGDAVMQMDLQNLPAYLFINISTKKLSLVYYRKDGNISWVDSGIKCV